MPRTRLPGSRAALVARIAPLALVLLLLGGAPAAAGGAADDTGEDGLSWSVQPAEDPARPERTSFAYTVDPGAVIQDGMIVRNKGGADLTLRVYAADGVTTASGHTDLQPADVDPTGLGSWVAVEEEDADLVLGPGESVEVGFTVTVPEDAAPGDHPGGIVASLSSAASGADGPVRLDRRLGSRINVRVSGEQRVGLAVDDVRVDREGGWNPLGAAPTTVSYTLANTGNVRTIGYADVTIAGPLDVGAARTLETVPEILPGAGLERTVALPDSYAWGLLTAEVTVTPESIDGPPGEAVSAAGSLWAVPWVALVAVALVLALVLTWVVRRRRRRALSAR